MERFLENHKAKAVALLAVLCLGTVGAGIYLKHYFAVVLFGVWLALEWAFLKLRLAPRAAEAPRARHDSSVVEEILSFLDRGDEASLAYLEERLSELRADPYLPDGEKRYVMAARDLIDLKKLSAPQGGRGRQALREAFFYRLEPRPIAATARFSFYDITLQDITDAAMSVSELYTRLETLKNGRLPELKLIAEKLSAELLSSAPNDRLVDSMRRDGGVSFLVLNLVRSGQVLTARQVGQTLLALEGEMDEEVRSSLYWISEIYWFTKEKNEPITDHETTIRYLYHLCFTNPSRAGFLEIDSQFFSQFEMINELAQEAFLFRENLVEKVLQTWHEHEGLFDGVFQSVLESVTGQRSKIYDEKTTWDRFWEREKENFARDYLYVVEGNLSFAVGRYDDARMYYEKALKLNPELRPALLNVVFCYARLGLKELHQESVDRLMEHKSLLPASLFVSANSFLLLEKEGHADVYYAELKKLPGWERKTEYYRSTFCFENGLFEEALKWARRAHEQNPADSSVRYHLSLCYNAVGEKTAALDLVNGMSHQPEWVNYYKFTLERDSGRNDEASRTLAQIPVDYFQDPDELEAAIAFARSRQDLSLLRHLRGGQTASSSKK